MPATRPSPKERARRAVDDLPDDATHEDVIARLVVVHKIERGRAQAAAGQDLMSQDEVEAHFARRWEVRS
ncbi:MAG: hypothetical protein AAF845_19620 [Bacteroidota bacterium]